MPRPYRYHVYHRPAFDTRAPWSSARISIRRLSGSGSEAKEMYSLKKDMDQLRTDGAAKGIVDASVVSVGTSGKGRKLWALKVGNGSSHKVLFTGCHHAREWISVEIPYLIAEYLIQKYKDNPTTDKEKRIKHLLMNRQIWFVPMVNPDGHEHTTTIDRMWRPNRQTYRVSSGTISRSAAVGGDVTYPEGEYTGVDINRNYATSNWGQETFYRGLPTTSRDPSDSGPNSIWCGIRGSGEKETSAIDALIKAQKFRASITYHSYSQLLLYPDAARSDAYVQWVGKGMNDLIASFGNAYDYQSSSALYPTTGDLTDFSYEKVPGRPTFTIELRPSDSNRNNGFSALPESEIEPCFRENLAAALALINCAGHSAAASKIKCRFSSATPASKCQIIRNGWEVFRGFIP